MNSKIQVIKPANTYCPRSFQSDMKAQNQLNQPGKPAQKKKKKKENENECQCTKP